MYENKLTNEPKFGSKQPYEGPQLNLTLLLGDDVVRTSTTKDIYPNDWVDDNQG